MNRLRSALPKETRPQTSTPAAIDLEKTKQSIQEMITHLTNFDPTASELFDSNRDAFQTFLPPETFATFEKQIGSFSFADAIVTLQQAMKEKGIVLS
jgi:hypothetical protein